MKAYPDNFKDADAALNEIEDVYNGPDPDVEVDPKATEGVYDGPDVTPCECVYAGPDYFGGNGPINPKSIIKVGSIGGTLAEAAERVKDVASKIKK